MVKHIVMWKLVDEKDGKTKDRLAQEFKEKLLALKTLIPQLIEIEVGLNAIHPDKNSDIVLSTTFNTFDDLTVYANHPDHLKVVEFAKTIVKERACVDYTI